MILSMTGYGKATTQLDSSKITFEIRTLNSKNLDVNMRLPSSYRAYEIAMRKIVAAQLLRGKIDVALHIENTGTDASTSLNIELLNNYVNQLQQVDGISNSGIDVTQRTALLDIASRFPDVLKTTNEEIDDSQYETILNVLESSLAAVQDFRLEEGNSLAAEFKLRISNISNLLDQVIAVDKIRLADVRTRLEKAVNDLKQEVDENRFEQELIYYLEKYDITEEKVRLHKHLNYFIETMALPQSQGKKLGFISQEMGREINTIGSKSNHAGMQQLVVQMKDELEKVKEQLLNVL